MGPLQARVWNLRRIRCLIGFSKVMKVFFRKLRVVVNARDFLVNVISRSNAFEFAMNSIVPVLGVWFLFDLLMHPIELTPKCNNKQINDTGQIRKCIITTYLTE